MGDRYDNASLSDINRGRIAASWLACEHPERPPDAFVRWHYDECRGCDIKLDVQVARFPDDPHVRWLRGFIPSTRGNDGPTDGI